MDSNHRFAVAPASAPAAATVAARALALALLLAIAGAAAATAAPPGDSPGQADADPVQVARAWRTDHAAEIVRDYAALLSMPNVARDTKDIHANAERLRDLLAARGVDATLWQLPDQPEVPPIVYGVLPAAANSTGTGHTIGIYVHYDGQPVDPTQWTATEPYKPALYDGPIEDGGKPIPFPAAGEPADRERGTWGEWRLYARSAGDDKAPFPAILGALDALQAAGIAPSANLVFFFEGEEEAGSTHLGEYMKAHPEELKVDTWLICDGPVHQSRRPQLVFGVRGYTGLDITVYGATRYLHSGHYGNWAPNPALRLAQLLGSMKDDDGRPLVDGFYDSTVPPSDAERRAIAALPDYDDQLRKELGLAETEMHDAPLAERLLYPSLNIRGMVSAAVGDEARNVIPTEATATLDLRLAKGNDPAAMLDLVEAHIRKQGYFIVREDPDLETRLAHPKIAKVIRRPGYPAARASMSDPAVQPVIAAARRVAGDDLVLLPTLGGSLPLYLFNDRLGAPAVIVPIANHDDNQHGPDENLRIENLWYGIDLMTALFTMR